MIYMSFVYGTVNERENKTILSRDEIKKRMNDAIANRLACTKVTTDPIVLALYEKFRQDVLEAYNSTPTLAVEREAQWIVFFFRYFLMVIPFQFGQRRK